MKALVKKEATSGVALTTDAWTSVITHSSATHTVHFIDSDWKLAFAPVPLQSATVTCQVARNVNGRPANRAGARSTLKTVDRGKMTVEEEKIALVRLWR